jgi:hypothetical protein
VTTFLKNSLCKSLDSVFLRCTVRRDKSPVKIGILAEIMLYSKNYEKY